MIDSITLLRSMGPVLTKTWQADGAIKGYDRAKNYSVETLAVSNIRDLSEQLARIEAKPTTVVIRGEPKPSTDLNYSERTLQAFDEKPRRWLALDIDSHIPLLLDPVAEPEETVREFIELHLPPEFHDATFHWQLTSSAGKPGAEHVLRARLWFWLTEPRGQAELEAWAWGQKLPVDVTVFRTVQPIYTAAPVIEDGAMCPVTQRHGLWVGATEMVSLQLTDDILASGRARRTKGRGEMVDPTEKKGLLGLFCRLYPPARVIDEDLVEGSFEWQDDSDCRINWLTSVSGSAGGVCITDDNLHFFCSHNEDPFEGRACNAWDFVRVHRFGELDEQIDSDAVAWLMSQGGMPSHVAMAAWVRELPDVAAELAEVEAERQEQQEAVAQEQQTADADRASRAEQRVQSAIDKIDGAASAADLERVICPDLAGEDWSDGERERLAVKVQKAFKALANTALPVAAARGWLRPAAGTAAGAPDWIERWVYVEEDKTFMSLDNKEMLAPPAFDARHTQAMPLRQGSTALREPASLFAVHSWGLRTVSSTLYAPSKGEVFRMERRTWANLFDPGSIPRTDDTITETGLVNMIESHMRRLVPDERERAILLSWMAHQVRSPGVKVRWAPYIWGPEGVGKSFLASVLDSCLGGRANVTRLGGRVLTSDFSGWSDGRAVTVIEEVYQAGHVYDVPEVLKTPITEDTISIHKKGKEAYDAPNFTNYLIFSNHADGIPVTESDRRYFFIETGISTEDARSLSEEGFFSRLFDAVRAHPGQLRRWLLELPVHVEFEPSGRAPVTAARAKVIELSKSEPDMLIEDLVDGRDVVSSKWLVKQAKDQGVELRTKGIQKALAAAGFEQRGRLRVAGIRHCVWARKRWVGDEMALRQQMAWMRLAAFDDLSDD